jgi:hypothetical protein
MVGVIGCFNKIISHFTVLWTVWQIVKIENAMEFYFKITYFHFLITDHLESFSCVFSLVVNVYSKLGIEHGALNIVCKYKTWRNCNNFKSVP